MGDFGGKGFIFAWLGIFEYAIAVSNWKTACHPLLRILVKGDASSNTFQLTESQLNLSPPFQADRILGWKGRGCIHDSLQKNSTDKSLRLGVVAVVKAPILYVWLGLHSPHIK